MLIYINKFTGSPDSPQKERRRVMTQNNIKGLFQTFLRMGKELLIYKVSLRYGV